MTIDSFANFVQDAVTKCPSLPDNKYYCGIVESVGDAIISGGVSKEHLASAKSEICKVVNSKLGWTDPMEPLYNPDKYISNL